MTKPECKQQIEQRYAEDDFSPEAVLFRWQTGDEELREMLSKIQEGAIPEDLVQKIHIVSHRGVMVARALRSASNLKVHQ